MGTLQETVLSSFLFIIAISGIQHIIKELVKYTLYADDLAIFMRGNDLIIIEPITSRGNRKTWAAERKTRTQVVDHKDENYKFHPKTGNYWGYQAVAESTCHNKSVNQNSLESCWIQKLTWKPHIQRTKRKYIAATNILKMSSGIKWGPRRKTLIRIHTSHIRPIMDYGYIIYDTVATSKNIKTGTEDMFWSTSHRSSS